MNVRQDQVDPQEAVKATQKVREQLLGSGIQLPADFDDDTPLITSGILDSLALLRLLIWVEEETGQSIDAANSDIASAWNTVRDIAAFVQVPAAPQTSTDASERRAMPPVGEKSIEFVRCDPRHHRDAVAEFQTAMWSADRELNAQYFDWKYRHSPYADDTRVYLAKLDGDVVGMRSLCGSLWEHGTPRKLTRAVVAEDMLVRADLRNTGILSALMRHVLDDIADDDIPYVLSLTAAPITVMNSLTMGWTRVGGMHPIERVSLDARLRRVSDKLAKRLPCKQMLGQLRGRRQPTDRAATTGRALAAGANLFESLDRAGREVRARGGVRVEITDKPPAEKLADLVGRLGHDGRIRHVRDPAFLTWRFNNPMRDYRFLTVGGRQLEGYLVLGRHTVPKGKNIVRIVDLESEGDAITRSLLDVVVRYGKFDRIQTWGAAHEEENLELMKALGFRKIMYKRASHLSPCWLVRSNGTDAETGRHHDDAAFFEPANWDLRLSYSMLG